MSILPRDQVVVAANGTISVESVATVDEPVSDGFSLSVSTRDAPDVDRTFVEADGTLTVVEGVGGRLLAVANRGKVPNAVRAASAGNLVCGETRIGIIIGNADLSEIRVVYSGYYMANGTGIETLPGNDASLEVALEIGAQVVQFTFGGQLVGTLSNGLAELVSDPIYPAAFGLTKFDKNATSYWLRSRQVVTSGQNHVRTTGGGTPTGEGTQYSNGLSASQLLSTGALVTPSGGASAGAEIMPSVIIGRTIGTPDVAALVIGDSIADGSNETVTSGSGVNDSGFISRGLYQVNGRTVPLSKMTCGGSSVRYMAAGMTRRRALFKYFTHAVCNYGSNDGVVENRTSAQVLADLKVVWAALKAEGVRWIEEVGIIPRTTSSDSFATVANQTPRPNFETGGAFRDALNAALQSNVGADGLDAYISVSASFADGTSLDKWAVPSKTTDGTHPSAAAHASAAPTITARAETWA